MRVEGVEFNESVIKLMKKDDFVDKMSDVFFLDRDEKARKAILADVFDKINGVSKTSSKKEVEDEY